jgi:tetratricopeptide (TPR) repeat protein
MKGGLAEGVVPGLLRDLYVGRKSGILHFKRGKEEQSVRVRRGHIVNARTNITGERLGEILVRHGRLSEEDLTRATETVVREKKRLGEVLVELGLIDETGLEDAVALRVHEMLTKIVTWNDGTFRFEEEEEEEESSGELTLKLSTGELILEAVRAILDPDVVRYLLGNTERVLAPSSDPILRFQKLALTPNDGFVLSRIDGTLSAREVEQLIPLPPEDVRRSLLGLISTGVVEYVDEKTRPGPRPEARPEAEKREDKWTEAEKPETGKPDAEEPATPDQAEDGHPSDGDGAPAAESPGPDTAPRAGRPGVGEAPVAATPPPQSREPVGPTTEERPKAEAEPLTTPEPEDEAATERRREIEEVWQDLKEKDHFEILGLTRKANAADVKEAYFKLARRFHPDVHHGVSLGDLRDKLEAVFIRLGEAYEVLRDTEKRGEYEERLGRLKPRPGSAEAPSAVAGTPEEPPLAENPESQAARLEQSVARAERLYAAARKAREDPSLKQNYFEAIQIVEPIVGRLTGRAQLRARLVHARCLQENPNWVKRAEETLRTAIEEHPEAHEAYALLGGLYEQQGLRARAASMFRRVRELRPNDEEAAQALARLRGRKTPPPDEGESGGILKKIFKKR